MKKLSQMKANFKKHKKKRPHKNSTNREIRFSRTKVRKVLTITIFGVIFLSLFFNLIFFMKYQTIRNNVEASENKIDDQLQEVENRKEGFTDSVVFFGKNFLSAYYNVPESPEEREKRLDDLNTYYVNGFQTSDLNRLEEFKGSRSLIDARYMRTEYLGDNKANLIFEVRYEITEIETVEKEVTKKDGDKKKTEIVKEEKPTTIKETEQIAVPVITDGEGYAVTGKPSLVHHRYTSDITLENPSLKGDDLTSAEKEQLKSFLTDFFTSYGVSDEKLPFMADVERGLNGHIFNDLVLQEVVQKENGNYQIIVDVSYQNEETSFKSVYTYYLVGTKENDKYFIESMKLGGF
ncbi:conjugal transfer protein [Halobacillus ihumii]|uniref:conjugal transfer protein n=1 Tax=Halobacillus ihumii TaxID=2686092 RepID=UPI0013D13345|nr:conjugal transfer protein [Halobacillus ihumii]